MRRLLVLGALAALACWALRRRRETPTGRVVIGFDDGSVRSPEPGSPVRELLLAEAREALRR